MDGVADGDEEAELLAVDGAELEADEDEVWNGELELEGVGELEDELDAEGVDVEVEDELVEDEGVAELLVLIVAELEAVGVGDPECEEALE